MQNLKKASPKHVGVNQKNIIFRVRRRLANSPIIFTKPKLLWLAIQF